MTKQLASEDTLYCLLRDIILDYAEKHKISSFLVSGILFAMANEFCAVNFVQNKMLEPGSYWRNEMQNEETQKIDDQA